MYSTPNIIRKIILIKIRWVGHVARKGDRRGAYRILVRRLEGKIHLEDLGVDGGDILKWIFMKWGGEL